MKMRMNFEGEGGGMGVGRCLVFDWLFWIGGVFNRLQTCNYINTSFPVPYWILGAQFDRLFWGRLGVSSKQAGLQECLGR